MSIQEEKQKTLTELLSRVMKELSSKALFDSTIVLMVIDFFRQEKIMREEILQLLKESFGGGFIGQLEQTSSELREMINKNLSKTLVGQQIS